MTTMQKAALTLNGNDIHLSIPIAKYNKEKRTVSGFATLDNIDSQDEIVTASAASKAFARARGNLREMHEKKAVGKIIDFKEDEYYDKESGNFYRGIYVTAYVSKGAPDTWEKVLDGTLSGFSIGGSVTDRKKEFLKDAGKAVTKILDFDLVELSLVDNPANPLANVFSIQKSADGSVNNITGMVADVIIENVFFCPKDWTIQSKEASSANCPECGTKMEIAGWFENVDDNRAEKVKEVVAEFLKAETSGGGVEMAKDNTPKTEDETVETGHEAGDPTEVPTPAQPADAENVDETAGTVEEAATVEEVTDETEEISKKLDSMKEELTVVIEKTLEKSHKATLEQVEELSVTFENFKKSVDSKISELDKKYSEFGENLEATKGKLADVENALEKFNSAEALRKSADLDDKSATTVQKSKSSWDGAFSIDNLLR